MRVEQNNLINFLLYLMAFNGMLIGLQVFEQVQGFSILPNLLKYGGLWGFAENHDYEVFKKGGIFPSTQSSSILSLLTASYIIYSRKKILLFLPIILGVFFGGRTTLILVFVLLGLVFMTYVGKLLVKRRAMRLAPTNLLLGFFYTYLSFILIAAWFDSGIGGHHLVRIKQAFSVVLSLDFSGGVSEGTAFGYFRLPSSGIETLIGNGVDRYHNLGGNDPFYSRWLLQSGIPSLFLLLLIFLICFFVERKRTPSFGFIVILLLIHGFKGEVITSTFFFETYLLYLFSKTSSANKRVI